MRLFILINGQINAIIKKRKNIIFETIMYKN